jgi:quinoprotein glucose dehydrogenase
VAEVSKQGFTYVFDRVSGQPVWPIEERPVDIVSDVPGEKTYRTQPFPAKPPAFSPQGVTLEDANDLTPEIHTLAVEEMKKYRLGPLFTPPSLRGTLQRPPGGGGANWGGAAFDPETGLLYVKTTETAGLVQICQNDGKDPYIDTDYRFYCNEMGPTGVRLGRGRGEAGAPTRGLGGVPLTKPPYAELVAINLNKGDIAWRVPNGEGSAVIRNNPLLRGATLPARLGSGTASGPLATKGGLVFAGAGETYLYVYDKATGREITRLRTPFRPSGDPMSYRTRSGRQFVVVATGAGPDASLVAFALPTVPK